MDLWDELIYQNRQRQELRNQDIAARNAEQRAQEFFPQQEQRRTTALKNTMLAQNEAENLTFKDTLARRQQQMQQDAYTQLQSQVENYSLRKELAEQDAGLQIAREKMTMLRRANMVGSREYRDAAAFVDSYTRTLAAEKVKADAELAEDMASDRTIARQRQAEENLAKWDEESGGYPPEIADAVRDELRLETISPTGRTLGEITRSHIEQSRMSVATRVDLGDGKSVWLHNGQIIPRNMINDLVEERSKYIKDGLPEMMKIRQGMVVNPTPEQMTSFRTLAIQDLSEAFNQIHGITRQVKVDPTQQQMYESTRKAFSRMDAIETATPSSFSMQLTPKDMDVLGPITDPSIKQDQGVLNNLAAVVESNEKSLLEGGVGRGRFLKGTYSNQALAERDMAMTRIRVVLGPRIAEIKAMGMVPPKPNTPMPSDLKASEALGENGTQIAKVLFPSLNYFPQEEQAAANMRASALVLQSLGWDFVVGGE